MQTPREKKIWEQASAQMEVLPSTSLTSGIVWVAGFSPWRYILIPAEALGKVRPFMTKRKMQNTGRGTVKYTT